jgi:N-methylhydantoinase A
MYSIGIDVGGTFTDIVAVDSGGKVEIAKAPSTPTDPSKGVMDALGLLADQLGQPMDAMLASTQRIVHGTTVATNALLERKGARTALLTTEGHRDVLEMREGLKDDRYNLRLPTPEPLVPRQRRYGVRERLGYDGTVRQALSRARLNAIVGQLREAPVDAIAICYLHAYREPKHELETEAVLRRAFPDCYICRSSAVYPQIKEFERVSTTVVNAYVGPIVERYLKRLDARLSDAGFAGEVLIILSHGGVTPIAEAGRLAAGTVLSGPAGGVAGARYSAALESAPDLIAFDMGGTSTDISMILNGEPTLTGDRAIAGQRIALPSLDIVTLGAGGGSIATVDAGGVLHVGPASAGANPGPACYGIGGAEATVTDANLALGYLDPGNFLGGRYTLDAAAGERVLAVLGERLGLGMLETAAGIHRVVNTHMAEGIRLVSVRRGVDPRRFALLSFGGAAGIHITALARELDIGRVIVPREASVLSAWGMLASDLRFETSRTHIGDTRNMTGETLRELFDEMQGEAVSRLEQWFDGEYRMERTAEMRYGEQIFEVNVSLDSVDWNSDTLLDEVNECFHRQHEALFTYALRDQDVVLVNARLAAVAAFNALAASSGRPTVVERAGEAAPSASRPAYFDSPLGGRAGSSGWHDTPVYDLESMPPGSAFDGPAIVESATTTVVMRPGDRGVISARGWLDIGVPKS